MKGRTVVARAIRRGFIVTALVVGVALTAGPSAADHGPHVLSIDDVTAVEGDLGASPAVFTVTLSPADPTNTITVAYTTSDGSASAGSDYGLTTGLLTFGPNDTEGTITVPVIGDTIDEADESFSVELSAPVNADISDGTGAATIADDDSAPNVSIGDASAVTEGGVASFPVTLSEPSGQTVTVDFSSSHVTTSAADLTGSTSGTVTFSAGDTIEQIQIQTVNDALDEADAETFTVTLSTPSNATMIDGSGTGTINDNDPLPSVSIGDALAVTEGSSASFPVTLSAASGRAVTVNHSTSHVSTNAADLGGTTSGTVTFAAGDTDETISIATVNDAADEADSETFTVTLSAPTNATLGTPVSGTGTINDDDAAPQLSIANAIPVTEGTPATFTVTLSATSDQTVTVDYASANVSTASGDFLGPTSGTLTFLPGDTSEPVSIGTNDDALDEATETFTVTLSGPTNATILDGSGTGTITDNDLAPTVSIGDALAVSEGGSASFPVTLSAPSGQTVTVSYSTTHVSTSAADFSGTLSGTVTFNPGATSQSIGLSTVDDLLDEADAESFTVTLSGPTNATLGVQSSAAGTISDDDPLPTVSIGDALAVAEGGSASFPVTLSAASGRTVTVAYSLSHGTTSAADLTGSTSGTVTFAAGDTSEAISIATINDSLDEPDTETFTVSLSAPANAIIGDGSGTGAINDNDATPTLSIGDALDVAEGGSASFPVTLSAPSGQTVTVSYSTSHGTTSAADLTGPTSGTVTFVAGDTSETISIATVNDTLDEPDQETFTVTLAAPANATTLDGSATGTITDNDPAPTVSIGDALAVGEGGSASFPVTLSAPSGQTVTVSYSSANGTAIAPGDYTAVAGGTVTFNPGEVSKQIQIQTSQDLLDEADSETFTVTLATPSNATILDGSATGTIADDDPLPAVSIADAAAVTEGGLAMFTVTLSAVSGRTVTVNYSVSHGTTSAADFAGAVSGTVTFDPGDTSEQINVSTVNDTVDELDTEAFSVTLAAPSNAIIGDGSGAGAITDNDAAPQLSIGNAVAVTEGVSSSFTVDLSAASGQTVTVSYSTANGSAAAPGDFNAVTGGTLTFAPGDTSEPILVQTNDDSFDEATESFTITLSAPTNATIAVGQGTGTGTINDNDPAPTVSIGDALAVSEGGSASFPVTLSAPSGQTVTVSYSTSHGTTSAADLSGPTSGTVTFAAGDTLETVSIATVNDTLDELDQETFTVTLAPPVNATILDGSGTGTITDNDLPPTVSIGSAPAITEGGVASFPVTLSAASAKTVTVDYSTTHGTTSAADFSSPVSGTLTIAPGTTTDSIDFGTVNDLLDEADAETFTLTLSVDAGSNATLGTPSSGTGTITDNDAEPQLSIADAAAVTEGGLSTFTVTLAPASGRTVTVGYASANGSATAPGDFNAVTGGTLTFNAGETSKQVQIQTLDDAFDEPSSESFTVTLSAPANATILDGSGTGTITDNDNPPTVSIGNALPVTEGGVASFPVTLSTPSGQTVTVGYASANGTAVAPGDYDSVASGSLTFLPGETSKQIPIQTSQDLLDEADTETFTVTLSTPSNATILDGSGTGTINDDDPLPAVSIGDAAPVTEGGTASFTVTLSAVSERTVTVNYATDNGSAVAPGDYTTESGTVIFVPGDTVETVTVATVNDTLDEVNETFSVDLTTTAGSNATISDGTGDATIVDNDGPAISIDNVTVDEAAGNAVFTLSLSAPSPQAISVQYTTANGTAASGSDFTGNASPLTVTIPANQPSGTISIPITNDAIDEVDETFLVNLAGPTNATISDSQGQATIVDNDGPTIAVTDQSPNENSGSTVFTVSLSASSPQTVTVQYTTADGTATSPIDYAGTPTVQTLTFTPGQTSKPVPVSIIEDAIDEANETFFLNLSAPTNAFFGDNQGVATIVDNDGPTVSIADATVIEGNAGTANAIFNVNLSAASLQPITVNFATANGTAVAPADYTSTSSPPPVSFAPGETSKTISVPVQGDTLDEADETFVVNLSGAVNATINDGQGTGTVTDDDSLPTLSISNASAVIEGDSGFGSCTPPVTPPFGQCASFTVTMSAVSGRTVTVGFATAPGSATPGVDFNGAAGTLTFDPGQTVKTVLVPIRGDTLSESTETFAVNLSSEVNASVADGQGLGTITDDDVQPSLSINDVTSANETGSLTFTVTLSPSSGQTVTVNYATADGTAGAGSDYQPQSSLLSFAAGETSKTLTVPLVQDGLDEDAEIFAVNLANASGATIADGSGTGTITDDDTAPTVSIGDAGPVAEGGLASFTISLSAASGKQVTVQYSTANGSAVAPGDFNSVPPTTVAFAPGETTKQAQVQTNDDTFDELDSEGFSVVLSSPVNTSISDGTGAGSITDNDPIPQLSINSAAPVVEGSASVFTVTLAPASERTVTVNYSTGSGSAAAGSDYTAVTNGAVAFAAGETTRTINIATINDSVDEADGETFTVTLATPSNAVVSSGQGTGTGTINDNDAPPTVSIGNATAVTEGGVSTFTVTLSAQSGRTVTVDYSTAHGTTGAADFSGATNGAVTFVPGDMSESITLATSDDSLDEAAESFTVTLAAPTNATIAVGQGTGSGTINDNDPTPTVSIENATPVVEGGTASFAVVLSSASGQTVTVNYATSNFTTSAGDFGGATSGTVTFAPGDVSKQISIVTADDSLDEPDAETFAVALASPTNVTIASGQGTATGTINDNDAPPRLSIEDAPAVTEGNTSLFTVSLSSASGRTITVNYSTANASAVAPGDYAAVTGGSVTFAPGETSQQISVATVNDALDEAVETFTVALVSPANATIANGQGTGSGTINDNDPTPTVSIGNSSAVTEGANAGFVVTLSAPSGQTVTVNYALNHVSTSAADFTPPTAGTVTFVPGDISEAISIATVNDALDEASPETFSAVLSAPVNATIAVGQGTGTGSINDDDPPPQLSISDAAAVVEGGTLTFTITLAPVSGRTVNVDYSTVNGTAAAPGDFNSVTNGSVTFNVGETTKTVQIATSDDTVNEAAETFTVALSNPTNATILDGSGAATINDNDPAPTVSIGDVTVLEGNTTSGGLGTCPAAPPPPANGCAMLAVTLSAASGQTVTVDYATEDGPAVDGATQPSDYALTTGTLTFVPGDTSETVAVRIVGDPSDEPNETFLVSLSAPVGATLGDGQGVARITDDDGPPALSISDAADLEGSGEVTAVVTLAPSSAFPVTVKYASTDASATAPADYAAVPLTTLTFAPGDTSKAIRVPVVSDAVDEVDESFRITLSDETINGRACQPFECIKREADRTGTLIILDDDLAPSVSIGDSRVTEGNAGSTNASFRVTLSGASGKPVTVAYATSDGTAVDPDDYAAVSGTLTFGPGQTSKTIDVAVHGDTEVEADETFGVALSSPDNVTIGDGQGSGAIVNDDVVVQPPPVDPGPPPPPPVDPQPPQPPQPPPVQPPPVAPPPPPPVGPGQTVLTGMAVSGATVILLDDLAPIGITCSKRARATCFGTVTLQGQARLLSSRGAKVVRLGRESYAISRGRTEKVLVSLSKRALKAVKRTGKLKVTVVVTARDSSGKRAKPIKRALLLKLRGRR